MSMAMDRLGQKQQKLLSHGSGGWKSKVKEPVGLVSPEAAPLVCCKQSSKTLWGV